MWSPKPRGFAVAALGTTLLAASCGAPQAGGGDQDSTTDIVLGVANEPDTLNPILGYAPDGSAKIFDGLVSYDADLNLEPALAKDLPQSSDDGKTYTYTLRDDVTFHDGKPLTSSDVAFTYRKVLDGDVNSANATDFEAVKDIDTPDKHTVVFHLKYPYAPFPKRTTLGIVPKHALADTDIESADFNRDPIGTGPYEVDEWRSGDRLVLRANKNYWDGEPAVKRVTVSFVPDDDTRAARLSSGDLDGAALPPKLARNFEGDSEPGDQDLRVLTRDTADYRGIVMPMNNPVTSDRAVRRAMNIGTDRKSMVKGLLLGHGEPAYGPLPPSDPWYDKDIEQSYDPERAKQLLDKAGWTANSGDDIRSKDATSAEFTLMYPAGDNLRKSLAITFADQMKKLGIKVDVEGPDWDAITPRMDEDALVYGTGSPYDPDFVAYDLYYSSLAGEELLNPGHYDNSKADAALEAGRHGSDTKSRKAAYRKLQEVQQGDPAMIFMVYLKHVYVMRDAWDGIEAQPEPHAHGLLHGPWWNLADWKPKS